MTSMPKSLIDMGMMRYIAILLIGIFISCQNSQNKPQAHDITALVELDGPWNANSISTTPNLFSDSEKLYVSWVELDQEQASLFYSVLEHGQWKAPQLISQGDDWFVNWADFPQLAVYGDHMIATFLQKSDDGTYTYDIYYTLKKGEQSWTIPKKLHRDNTKAEHGFVSIAPGAQGFVVSWLDGRNTVTQEHTQSQTHSENHHEPMAGAMTLRSTTVHFDGSLAKESLIDSRVCDCCQTAVVLDENGQAFVAYRGRSEKEVRDILLRKGHPEKQWSDPVSTLDNWLIPGCPVNGPSLDLCEASIVLAWFTAENDDPRVELAFSSTRNLGLSQTIRMDSGNAVGRVDVVQLTAESAIVSWVEPKDTTDYIRAQWVNIKGEKGPMITVSTTSSQRATGFPRMVGHKENLYLTSTRIRADKTREIYLKRFPKSMMLPQGIDEKPTHD